MKPGTFFAKLIIGYCALYIHNLSQTNNHFLRHNGVANLQEVVLDGSKVIFKGEGVNGFEPHPETLGILKLM